MMCAQTECPHTSRMSLSMLLGTPTTATLTPRRQHSSWMAFAACDQNVCMALLKRSAVPLSMADQKLSKMRRFFVMAG